MGERWGVGLDHEAVGGDQLHGLAEFEGRWGTSTPVMLIIALKSRALRIGGAAGEAVEGEAVGSRAGLLQDRDKVIEGLAAVQDDREPPLFPIPGPVVIHGLDEGELLVEHSALARRARALGSDCRGRVRPATRWDAMRRV